MLTALQKVDFRTQICFSNELEKKNKIKDLKNEELVNFFKKYFQNIYIKWKMLLFLIN